MDINQLMSYKMLKQLKNGETQDRVVLNVMKLLNKSIKKNGLDLWTEDTLNWSVDWSSEYTFLLTKIIKENLERIYNYSHNSSQINIKITDQTKIIDGYGKIVNININEQACIFGILYPGRNGLPNFVADIIIVK